MKKNRLDFLHSAFITNDTLIQKYRRTLPNSKNSNFPIVSIGAHCDSSRMRDRRDRSRRGSNGNFDEPRTSSEVKNWISPRNFLKSSVLRGLPPKISSTFVDRSSKYWLKICHYRNRSLFHHDRRERSAWQKLRSTCDLLHGASKCSRRGEGVVVGFTGELHRFSSG